MYNDYEIEIFIPTYNRSELLKKCLKSISNLQGPSPLITVLDNGSAQQTDKVINSFQKKLNIRHIKRPFNAGMFTNLNSIPALVRTEYFSFITDDDEYLPNFLNVHGSMRAKDYDFTVSNCDILRFDGTVEPGAIKQWDEVSNSNEECIINSILHGFPVVTHMVFTKSVLEDFYFDPELGTPSDAYLLMKLMTKYKYTISENTTGYWNYHEGSASTNQTKLEIRVMQMKILRRQRQFLQFLDTNRNAQKLLGQKILRYKLSMLKAFLQNEHSLEETRMLWKI